VGTWLRRGDRPASGARRALVIATSRYTDPTLSELPAPGLDAPALADVLGAPEIGAFTVSTLFDEPGDRWRRLVVETCTSLRPADLLLLYLSCHAVLDDRGDLYCATVDTDRSDLPATAVSAGWLSQNLDACRARRQIVILDCCRTGTVPPGARGPDLALGRRLGGRRRVVLTAPRAADHTPAADDVSGQPVRPAFTRALVDGLVTGEADRDRDGLITMTDAHQHLCEQAGSGEPGRAPELWSRRAGGDLLLARSTRGLVIDPDPSDVTPSVPEGSRPAGRPTLRHVAALAAAAIGLFCVVAAVILGTGYGDLSSARYAGSTSGTSIGAAARDRSRPAVQRTTRLSPEERYALALISKVSDRVNGRCEYNENYLTTIGNAYGPEPIPAPRALTAIWCPDSPLVIQLFPSDAVAGRALHVSGMMNPGIPYSTTRPGPCRSGVGHHQSYDDGTVSGEFVCLRFPVSGNAWEFTWTAAPMHVMVDCLPDEAGSAGMTYARALRVCTALRATMWK